jgi:hypothetical protein
MLPAVDSSRTGESRDREISVCSAGSRRAKGRAKAESVGREKRTMMLSRMQVLARNTIQAKGHERSAGGSSFSGTACLVTREPPKGERGR